MTLVNAETGELFEPLTEQEAERLTTRIALKLDAMADTYAGVMPLIREAIDREAFKALGYRSPGEYVSDRFGGSLSKLGVEIRREVVRELTDAGMSTRAIAPVVGVDNATVHRDLRRVAPATPADDDWPEQDLPTPTEWEDETSGPAPESQAAPAEAQEHRTPADDATAAAGPQGEGEDLQVAPASNPRPAVTGIDGKTYRRSVPAAPRRAPLTDSFFRGVFDLQKKAESLHRLVADDRWTQNAEKVAAAHRNDLLRTRDLLEQVINALPEQESTQ